MKEKFSSETTPAVCRQILRLWDRVGYLEGVIEVLEERIRKLERPAVVIDADEANQPSDARERNGNVVCLPGVRLRDLRPDGGGRPRRGRRRS